MKFYTLAFLCLCSSILLHAQDNIYTLREQLLKNKVIEDKRENGEEKGDDDAMAKFDRWFHQMEPRCYPSGSVPSPDLLLKAWQLEMNKGNAGYKKTGTPAWQPIGPMGPASNSVGVGRINCIVVNPQDTNTLYIGAAGGGLFISHNGGKSWKSNSDQFPALSIADIAINPIHPDTIYAATGDEYGYENYLDSVFWGGLYSAGIVMSADGGNTWHTTGLSYLQSNRDIVQKILVHPRHPNILLAGTRKGIFRSTDAGASWTNVDPNEHVYSMAFMPTQSDTIYAVNDVDLRVSYNAGLSWQTLHYSINSMTSTATNNRTSLAVSPAAPNDIWILDNNNDIKVSRDRGHTFNTYTSPNATATFYGYYDRVLSVSPVDSNYILAGGFAMAETRDGGISWRRLDSLGDIHPDNHALTFNPANPNTFYSGNDGGIYVSNDKGKSWTNLSDSLMISQIYRTTSSHQNPYRILCGLQDNSTFSYDGSTWTINIGGDGEACAISPEDDNIQIGSYQYGKFFFSYDQGSTFNQVTIAAGYGSWTAPVVFAPNSADTIYFGLQSIYASYDAGASFSILGTGTTPFYGGATCLSVAPSNPQILYTADYSHILRTIDGGTTWTDVTGNLSKDSNAITHIAVDYKNPMRVYVSTSGYRSGKKVYYSGAGGTTWTNISANLPNLPANCIAVDSSVTGALYVATDIGVYYRDSSITGWIKYGSGLPNIAVEDLDINYLNRKVRAATFGRGLWEIDLQARNTHIPNSIATINGNTAGMVKLYPNPTNDKWNILFPGTRPVKYSVKVSDATGRTMYEGENTTIIDASKYRSGVYIIDVITNDTHYYIKAQRR